VSRPSVRGSSPRDVARAVPGQVIASVLSCSFSQMQPTMTMRCLRQGVARTPSGPRGVEGEGEGSSGNWGHLLAAERKRTQLYPGGLHGWFKRPVMTIKSEASGPSWGRTSPLWVDAV
jgi:hypothetical protein